MAVTKELVCLANSRKHLGRCIAGIDIESESWVRPVSSRQTHEVSAPERQYRDGAEPRILDVVSMRLLRPKRFGFQTENWVLDPNSQWVKLGRIRWADLCRLEQKPKRLWLNSDDSTRKGLNDRVPVEQKFALMNSLKLIRVSTVTIEVDRPFDANKELEVRAKFRHAGSTYILKVTDALYEEKFRALGVGSYCLSESFLTVSLGEEFKGYLYKMVAAIIERRAIESGSSR
ncbi:dual OB domain-containing protein [Streptomyces sp. NPDC020607]|uniref:dual OB domain-containing protein n=1 Tax=Streptomyces sp. NPDC020607 TaxID=3365082 RepID=UPI0037B2F8D5